MEYSQPKSFRLKKGERNLRSVVNWQGMLKQIAVEQLVGILLTNNWEVGLAVDIMYVY